MPPLPPGPLAWELAWGLALLLRLLLLLLLRLRLLPPQPPAPLPRSESAWENWPLRWDSGHSQCATPCLWP